MNNQKNDYRCGTNHIAPSIDYIIYFNTSTFLLNLESEIAQQKKI